MMNGNLLKAKEILLSEEHTLVLYNGTEVITSHKRGVKPLLELIDSGPEFSSFAVADKVVGAAAAYLYVLLNIKEIYASVLSEKAETVLTKYGIAYYSDKKVPYIINRKGDGMCPMENTVENAVSPEDALSKIRCQLRRLMSK